MLHPVVASTPAASGLPGLACNAQPVVVVAPARLGRLGLGRLVVRIPRTSVRGPVITDGYCRQPGSL